MSEEQEDRYCQWCGRQVEEGYGNKYGYWCITCDHSFNGPGLTLEELEKYPRLFDNRYEPHEKEEFMY